MIFLIGGEGFVGGGFARVLHERGLPFEIINRKNYDSFVGKSCDLLINSNGNSSKVLARNEPDTDFFASVDSVRRSLGDFRYDRYLFLSSSDVYPDSSSPDTTREEAHPELSAQSVYGFHKHLAEQLVRHRAPNWMIIRQGGFVGPDLKKNAVYDVLNGDRIWVHPESRFQYIHVDDSARAILDLMARAPMNEIYNVAARGTISVSEIMQRVGQSCSFPQDAVAQTYEISVEKAAGHVALPSTNESVSKFLEELGLRQ